MKPHQSLLFFMLRFAPALVFSLASSLILTLPFFQKSIADNRIREIQKEIDAAQHHIDANWRKGNHADGSVNTNVKITLDAKRGIIADNTEEIRKIRNTPLQSRELTFIEQMETVVEEAMTNRIDLFLHGFFWLFFFTVEMIPLILFYLDQNNDSYKASIRELEKWRITKAFEEITEQSKNEILAKQVETIETVYQNKKTVQEYQIKIRELELEQRKTLHRLDAELRHLEREQTPSAVETVHQNNRPLNTNPPRWPEQAPPATSAAVAKEDSQTASANPPDGAWIAELETPATPLELATDSEEADFLERLQRHIGAA